MTSGISMLSKQIVDDECSSVVHYLIVEVFFQGCRIGDTGDKLSSTSWHQIIMMERISRLDSCKTYNNDIAEQ